MHKSVWIKMVTLLLTVLLLSVTLVNTGFAAADVRDLFAPVDGLASPATSAQAVQDALYVLLEDKMVSLTQGQDAPALVMDFSKYPDLNWAQASLTSDGKALYVLDPLVGEIYQLIDGELEKTVTLDLAELGTDLGNGLRYVTVDYPIIQDGFLHVLYHDADTYPEKVFYRFSIKTGERTQIPIQSYSLRQIANYKEGQLLGVDEKTNAIIAIDAKTGKQVAEIGVLPDYMD